MKNILLFVFILFYFFSFSQSIQPPFYKEDTRWVDSVMSKLSLEEKIAQLIMVKAYSNRSDKHVSEVAELVSKYKVGGIIFFQGGPARQVRMSNYFQSLACVPLFIGIDGEWGLSMRLDSTIVYPKQITLGAIKNDTLIYKMGADIAWQLHRTGMQMNFAPVIDINSNPRNPVIGSRSFGEDKMLVTKKSLQYMRGLQDNRVLATAKHFPGHGDTETDSHFALPVLNYSYEHIDSIELYPFKNLFNEGISSVMTAHLNISSLDSTAGIPASLSPKIVTGLLKNKMGFTGLIFTDALNMKGSANTGKPWDVGYKAFMAGNDILLMPDEVPTIIDRICNAVGDSIVSINDINNRCRKVLLAKEWTGLNKSRFVNPKGLFEDINSEALRFTQQKLFEESLTLLKNQQNIIPIKRLDTLRIATLSIGNDSLSVFQQYCDLYAASIKHFFIEKNASTAKYDSVFGMLDSYNLILASIINTDIRVTKNYGINDYSIDKLKSLSSKKEVVLTLFSSPYSLSKLGDDNNFKAIIMAYEDKDPLQIMAPQLIFGGIGASGKLPVTVTPKFQKGTGIEQNKTTRYKYTMPEEIGIASTALNDIDSIINDAIKKHAMPGCQVLAAKDGKIFYNKSFGYHTYDSTRVVLKSDLYDIASITKIAATVPAIMKLYDNNDLSIHKKIINYIPQFKKTDKKNITISELLLHQSGLQSWLPLYLSSLKTIHPEEKLLNKKKSENYSHPIHDAFINNNTTYNPYLISNTATATFNVPVADRLFTIQHFNDSVIHQIAISKLKKKKYKYSDLGFMLLYNIVESESDVPFDSLLNRDFYRPLGLKTMGFLPLLRFDKTRIPPSENDQIFRKQIVQGYVNDANCSMLGGISGHAGLFANANDVAVLMQMYLNKGIYGGKRFLSEKHMKEFTACQNSSENRRGLGFDKPEPDTTKESPVSKYASLSSYGHTGFTGCMAWVDPQYNLVYVFLSNRTFPDPEVNKLAEMNVRTKIQDVIYKLIIEHESRLKIK